MAEIFAPFVIDRTIGNLTFYRMAGRNFVRKKSRLTRKQVLHSPKFERTRHYAGLMARASKIGSQVYNGLPEGWRQFWMYRAFTGEALKMFKLGMQTEEIEQVLWRQYIKEIVDKSMEAAPINKPPKRVYRKKNITYWKQKTIKAGKSKARRQLTSHYAGLLAQASQMASVAYRQLPLHERKGGLYHMLVAEAMRLLKAETNLESTPPVIQAHRSNNSHIHKPVVSHIKHANGHYYFNTALPKPRWALRSQLTGILPLFRDSKISTLYSCR